MTDTCTWHEDENDGCWDTDCGEAFVLNDGTPESNHMKFCCYCGKPLVTDEAVGGAEQS
jgi:hypothetical protein